MKTQTRSHFEALDRDDPLAFARERFALPKDVIYLDGNSLGALVKSVARRMQQAIEHEWGVGLIRSWNDAAWYPAPLRVGNRIATLVGADEGEIAVCDSTSVNLYKVMTAAARMRPGRRVVITERGNFPTDLYVAEGVARALGLDLRCVDADELEASMAGAAAQLALVSLTQVNYKSGRIHDMARITALTQAQGALSVWDLAHSAGSIEVDLNACHADMAVGCGYKFLNGGPGAPAFVFVAKRHQDSFQTPLQGWHGHATPFDFAHDYAPHAGIDRLLVGTAPQLSLIALEEALTAFDGVTMRALRTKNVALTQAFIHLVDEALAGHGFGLASPREASARGSQVALTHEHGYAIVQALIARGVIGDFRSPDILRFGFNGLYVRHVDVWEAVATLKDVMLTRAWDRPEFLARKAVT